MSISIRQIRLSVLFFSAVIYFPLAGCQTDMKYFVDFNGIKFIRIPQGNFKMGSDNGYEDQKPVHLVEISKTIYLQETETTQEQWTKIMGNNPSYFKGSNLPVEAVSYDNVMEFIEKLNLENRDKTLIYRLPTEEEWEYACRATTTSEYSFGDNTDELSNYAWYGDLYNGTTHPVGQKRPNKWGFYDMHGNVWEWCLDRYRNGYKSLSEGMKDYFVRRGGCWSDIGNNCRSACRGSAYHDDKCNYIGFRLCIEKR